jgi:DNA uptake protein ComE-like DNA-binding protein
MRTLRYVFAAAVVATTMLGGPADAQVGQSPNLLDPNLATEQQLTGVPHLTPALIRSIMDKRPFLSMTELNAVLSPTLGKPQLAEVYGRMFVHLNLNTATPAQILLIPNAGQRMVREFQEYRPFKALAQFHREIDKYVDDAELARLEQYVFVALPLNSASDADFLTIPGLGARMLREFKEYRPYKAVEQFRREMGKYVDSKEVARLERYVVID